MSAPAVRAGLTPDRPTRTRPRAGRRVVENDDYARFTRRILAAHGRRIGSGDIEGLTDLSRLATEIDAITADAVTGLRAAGYSWAEIAVRLGTTRQAAHQRYGGRG